MKPIKNQKIIAGLLAILMTCSISAIDSTKVLAANSGGVWVNGVNIITASNNTVQCGSGTAVYDSSTNTLTLNNAAITERNDFYRAIGAEDTEINIVLVGNNTIKPASDVYPIYSGADITLSGEGTLTAESGSSIIYSLGGTVTIDGTAFHAKSSGGAAIQAETGINIKTGLSWIVRASIMAFIQPTI